jgi:hypothetical protein
MKWENIEQLTLRLLHQLLKRDVEASYSVRDNSEAGRLIKEAEEFFKHWDENK